MQETHCPFCQTRLETIDVAPCWSCGWVEDEIQRALDGTRAYSEMRIFGDLSAILCEICPFDLGSYAPTFFGRHTGRINSHKMQFVRSVEVAIRKDKFCLECKMRLAFIRFVLKARELNGQNTAN